MSQLCGPDWQAANRAGEDLARMGDVAAKRLVKETITPTLTTTEGGGCDPMLQRALVGMPANGAGALQEQLAPVSPLDLPNQVGLFPPLLHH